MQAQQPSIYDEKGKVQSVELRKYGETLNKQREAEYKSSNAGSNTNRNGQSEESEDMKDLRRKDMLKYEWPLKKPTKYDYRSSGLVAIRMGGKFG